MKGLQHAQALGLARRAAVLKERFFREPIPADNLLLARIHAALGEDEEARRLVDLVAETCGELAPSQRLVVTMLELALSEAEGEAGLADRLPRRTTRSSRRAGMRGRPVGRTGPRPGHRTLFAVPDSQHRESRSCSWHGRCVAVGNGPPSEL